MNDNLKEMLSNLVTTLQELEKTLENKNADEVEIKMPSETPSGDAPRDVGESKSTLTFPIDEYVIIRSYNEGINAGYLEEADETGCVLREARRLRYHEPKDKSLSWYEGVSLSGLSSDSTTSPPALKKVILENYSITLTTEEAKESIINAPVHPCTA